MPDFRELSSNPKRVLVTGSAGNIGRMVCKQLKARGHFVRGFDRVETTENVDDAIVSGLDDRVAIDKAMQEIDCVVHLAARAFDGPFEELLIPNNFIGLYNIIEGARQAGVRRVVFASTIMTIQGHYARNEMIKVDDLPLPKNQYALSKAWAEQMCEMYSREYGMDMIAARIGWTPSRMRSIERLDHNRFDREVAGIHLYLSRADAGRFFTCAVESDSKGFHVLYVVSNPAEQVVFDLEPSKRVIGYEPQHTWPQGFEDLEQ